MSLVLCAPTREDMEMVREWRNTDGVRAGLRTPFMLTEEMQADFYQQVICNRQSVHRYWSIVGAAVKAPGGGTYIGDGETLLACGGLTDIAWENGHAEISLIVHPERADQGIGSEAVALILREAFQRMRLLTVFGEVYHCNPALAFWEKQILKHHGGSRRIPRRKWWDGELHDATLFWFKAP